MGGLTERKNPIGLLQAFARVRAVRPDARLAFVGDGPQARAVDIGVARLGLESAVLRAGALPHEQVADWVAACDMLAMVSRVEPLGVAALEALAGGRPVIATRVGGPARSSPTPAPAASWTPWTPPRSRRPSSPSSPAPVPGGLPRRRRAERPHPAGPEGGGDPGAGRGRASLSSGVSTLRGL